MPKEYLVPKSICDYSRQEVYYLDEEAAANLTGAVGALLGTGIAEILEKGRKKSGQYE